MTDNVIPLGNITYLDLPTQRVLEAAKAECTDTVVVLGYDEKGDFYFSSSVADGGAVIWLLEQAKLRLLDVVEDM